MWAIPNGPGQVLWFPPNFNPVSALELRPEGRKCNKIGKHSKTLRFEAVSGRSRISHT